MIIYIGERGSGKTTMLIEMSEKTGATIVVATYPMVKYIQKTAGQMGKKIPVPITVTNYIHLLANGGLSKSQKYLVDELQMILHGMNIEVATCDNDCLRALGNLSSAKSQPDRYINATQLIATLEGAIERAEREEPAGIEKLWAVTSMKYAKRLLEEASKTEGERG